MYLALGGTKSSTAAISSTGWAWSEVSLPVEQDWKSAATGNDVTVMIGGSKNTAIVSENCINWTEVELPITAAWTDICYGSSGFIMVANTLSGSGSKRAIALTSTNGYTWSQIDFPIGEWTSIEYGGGMYMAVGGKQFIYSPDGKTWSNSMLPASATSVSVSEDGHFICGLGLNNYLISDAASTVQGSFSFVVPTDEGITVSDVYVTAEIENTVSDTSYASNGEKLLASNAEDDVSGGDPVAVTTDLRYGLDVDGIMLSATFEPETKTVHIDFIADINDTAIKAPMSIVIEYQGTSEKDLEYQGLTADFDNANQIITTNKEALNLYEYFNKRFLRFIKGLNKLTMKTDSGSCKVTITCEFLRKVGGR